MIVPGILCFLIALSSGADLDDLPLLDGGIRRISSYDRDGGDRDFFDVAAQSTLVMADIKGAGTIKRFYIKVDSDDSYYLRSMVLRFYWDGARDPCVESPLGDFFGLGHCRHAGVVSIPVVTGSRRGMTCYFPMPFFSRALMVLANEGRGRTNRVTYQIDYTAGEPPEGAGLFHAQYTQGFLERSSDDYVVLHAKGKGKYVGTVLSVVLGEDGRFWEGDEKFYVDGAEAPAVRGTGMDDYFGGAFGFEPGFCAPWFGTPVAGDDLRGAEFTGYRFHVKDPITFEKELVVTMEHRGQRFVGGRKLYDTASRRDEYYSVAFWYQTHPHKPFTPLAYMADRISGDRKFTVEGEAIEVTDSSKDSIDYGVLDGETLLLFGADEKGDSITLRTFVKASGVYDVAGTFLRSRRCGVYQLLVNGFPLGDAKDFFNDRGGKGRDCRVLDDKIDFGEIKITAGPVLLEFLAQDPNPASRGSRLGIDSLLIEPVVK